MKPQKKKGMYSCIYIYLYTYKNIYDCIMIVYDRKYFVMESWTYLSLLPFSYCKSPRTNNSWSLPSNPRIYQERGDSFCIEIVFRFDVLTLKPSLQFDHGKNFLSLSETETQTVRWCWFRWSFSFIFKIPIENTLSEEAVFFSIEMCFLTARRVWCFFRAPNGGFNHHPPRFWANYWTRFSQPKLQL